MKKINLNTIEGLRVQKTKMTDLIVKTKIDFAKKINLIVFINQKFNDYIEITENEKVRISRFLDLIDNINNQIVVMKEGK